MTNKEDEWDGCGVRPVSTGKDDPFYEACQWHDKAYTAGSKLQEWFSRLQVDRKFLQYMIQAAGSSLLLRLKAYSYYAIVRLVGGRFWEGKK